MGYSAPSWCVVSSLSLQSVSSDVRPPARLARHPARPLLARVRAEPLPRREVRRPRRRRGAPSGRVPPYAPRSPVLAPSSLPQRPGPRWRSRTRRRPTTIVARCRSVTAAIWWGPTRMLACGPGTAARRRARGGVGAVGGVVSRRAKLANERAAMTPAARDRCIGERCGRWSDEACEEESRQRAADEGCELRCRTAGPCFDACDAKAGTAREACRDRCAAALDPGHRPCTAACEKKFPGRPKTSACDLECPDDPGCERRSACLATCTPVCFAACRH